jgi:hypothetical protein
MNTALLRYNYFLIFKSETKQPDFLPEEHSSRDNNTGKIKTADCLINYLLNKLFRRIKGITTSDIFTLFHAVEYDCNKEIFAFFFHNSTSSSLYINRTCHIIFNPSPPFGRGVNIFKRLNIIFQKFMCLFHYCSDLDEIPAWDREKVPC